MSADVRLVRVGTRSRCAVYGLGYVLDVWGPQGVTLGLGFVVCNVYALFGQGAVQSSEGVVLGSGG